jgi:hypothetical protein
VARFTRPQAGFFFEPFPDVSGELSAASAAVPSTSSEVPVNSAQLLLRRLAKLDLRAIGAAIGKDETTACRVRSEERSCSVSEFAALVSACGLKIVDKDKVCVDRRAYDSLRYIAGKAMANEDTARTLVWEDDQA